MMEQFRIRQNKNFTVYFIICFIFIGISIFINPELTFFLILLSIIWLSYILLKYNIYSLTFKEDYIILEYTNGLGLKKQIKYEIERTTFEFYNKAEFRSSKPSMVIKIYHDKLLVANETHGYFGWDEGLILDIESYVSTNFPTNVKKRRNAS